MFSINMHGVLLKRRFRSIYLFKFILDDSRSMKRSCLDLTGYEEIDGTGRSGRFGVVKHGNYESCYLQVKVENLNFSKIFQNFQRFRCS